MIYTTPETKTLFLLEIDKYGDSYGTDTSTKNLQQVFSFVVLYVAELDCQLQVFAEVGRELEEADIKLPEDFKDLEATFFGKPWWGLFRTYVVYVDRFAAVGYRFSCRCN